MAQELRYLRHLTRNAADEWREMWNNEVLPSLQAAHVIAGAGVRIDRRPNGTTISVDPTISHHRRHPQQEFCLMKVTEFTPVSGGGASGALLVGSGAAVAVSLDPNGGIVVASGGNTSGGNTSGGNTSGGAAPVRIIFPYLDGIPIPETSPSSEQ